MGNTLHHEIGGLYRCGTWDQQFLLADPLLVGKVFGHLFGQSGFHLLLQCLAHIGS